MNLYRPEIRLWTALHKQARLRDVCVVRVPAETRNSTPHDRAIVLKSAESSRADSPLLNLQNSVW